MQDDEFSLLSGLVAIMRSDARTAHNVAFELNRDKMLSVGATHLASNILRDLASIDALIAQARVRGGRK